MIFLQDLGEYDLADENFLDVQSITDAMMTTAQSLTELAIRFFLNLAVCWVIVGLFYYRKSRRRDYYFTFMVFSTAMLMLLYIMGNVEVGVGLTLGLFAIFGVIRYRTETVPIREMTYLFVIIALAAMNGLAPLYRVAGALSDNPHYALNTGALLVTVISNLLVIGLIWFLESDKVRGLPQGCGVHQGFLYPRPRRDRFHRPAHAGQRLCGAMRKILLTLSLLLPAAAFAQTTYDDGVSFGARATVEADAKLAKGLHLMAHEQFRYYGDSEDIMRFHTGIGLEYKVLPFLKVGAEYELINRYKYETDENDQTYREWSVRHRGNFFLTGTLKTGDWQFGLKETLRLTHRPGDMNTLQAPRNALALKSKFSAKYQGWGKVVPFAGFEVRNALNDAAYKGSYNPSWEKNKDIYLNEEFLGYTHAYVNRYRIELGTTIKFDKRHALEFYLLGDHYMDKSIDTNREGSSSWEKNGLVLKAIDWHVGNMITAGVGYKWEF